MKLYGQAECSIDILLLPGKNCACENLMHVGEYLFGDW